MFRVTFCFLILASATSLLGCRSRTPMPSQNATSTSARSERKEFGDFSFDLPQDWISVTPDRGKTIAMLLLGGSRWEVAKGMIKVDVGSPSFPSAQAMAESVAKGANGQVERNAIDLAGEKGVKVTTSSINMDKPRAMIIVFRGAKAYLIMTASAEGTDTSRALERVRESWKWSNK